MADFSCSPLSQCDKMKAARKVLEAPAEPDQSDPSVEDRAMAYGDGYSAAVCADKSERIRNIVRAQEVLA